MSWRVVLDEAVGLLLTVALGGRGSLPGSAPQPAPRPTDTDNTAVSSARGGVMGGMVRIRVVREGQRVSRTLVAVRWSMAS